MDVRIVDRHRNVTQVPTKGFRPDTDLFSTLDSLLRGQELALENAQLEFLCDREFAEALNAYAFSVEDTPAADAYAPGVDGAPDRYRGVPITVVGEPAPGEPA